MSTSNKFKIGDTIRRTDWDVPDWGVYIGQEYTVSELTGDTSRPLRVHGVDHKLNDSFFELVQAASEQPAVLTPLEIPKYLTPQEVTECIINEVPVQYKTSPFAAWTDLQCPKDRVSFYAPYTYRKKPTTVLINGISVPAPAVVYNPSIMFDIDLRRLRVQHVPTRCIKADSTGLYWSTKEDAQAVLDAILTSFSK